MNNRIKLLRKDSLNLTRKQFGEKLGVSADVIANIEYDRLKRPDQKEPLIQLICKKFNVSEEWLRNGTGSMFEELSGHDELATYAYSLMQEPSPLNDLIIEIMRTYSKLDSSSQKVIDEAISLLVTNIQQKKTDNIS